MGIKGVHYLAYNQIKERIAANDEEYSQVAQQLQEAIKLGDLSENSEYDAARAAMERVVRVRDSLAPVMSMPVIRSNDSAGIIEPGCVLDLAVYGTTPEPLDPKSEEFAQIVNTEQPVFYGKVMLGGILPVHELLADSALSDDPDTPIPYFLLGKKSGWYSIKVPGGFAVVTAKKLKSTEFTKDEIRCVYRG